MAKMIASNAIGMADEPYVPEKGQGQGAAGSARHARRLSGACRRLGRAVVAGVAVGVDRAVLLGQPFLRAYLLAEHARCPHVANMLENTRTTFTTALVRLIAWNMPFHAEHHAYPAVPFHKLPRFHEFVRQHLRTTERGYVQVQPQVRGRSAWLPLSEAGAVACP